MKYSDFLVSIPQNIIAEKSGFNRVTISYNCELIITTYGY
jgi:hypothetical protein